MSKDITVSIQRGTSTIASGVPVQLDNLSIQEAAYYGGAAPYQRFTAFMTAIHDVRQTDLLVDSTNVDPKTTLPFQYRVISFPEPFPDQHMEMVVDLVRGT